MNRDVTLRWLENWFSLSWEMTGQERPDLRGVQVCDSTLREGLEEGRSVYPRKPPWQDVLQLARAVEELRLNAVELPGPDFMPVERLGELYRCFEHTPISAKIEFSARDPGKSKARIDEAVDLGAEILTNDDAGSSDWFLGTSHPFERLVDALADVVAYGKEKGVRFHATTSDAFRAPLDRLVTLARELKDAGADVVGLKDTFGLAMPTQVFRLVTALRDAIPGLVLEIHCHDDTGLGLANTLAAAEAGAQWLDGCLNGLGDRSGHTALEQLIVTLELSYGVETGIPLDKLRQASLLVQQVTGLAQGTKPMVGRLIFNEARGRHLVHPLLLKLALSGWRGDSRIMTRLADELPRLADHTGRTLDETWAESWLETRAVQAERKESR